MRNDLLIRLVAPLCIALAAHAQEAPAGHAIASLSSEDFSDLAFLKPLLDGKRVVALGESAHGVAQFNRLKVRLVKYLHRELGYDVIAFESNIGSCDVANAHVAKSLPVDVMRDCLFPVWHTTDTVPLFEYLERVRKEGGRLDLAGFDTQPSGMANPEVSARLLAMIDPAEQVALYLRVSAAERRIAAPGLLEDAERIAMARAYADLTADLVANAAQLQAKRSLRPIEVNIAIREAESRRRFVMQRDHAPNDATMKIRDEGMADNVDFLLDVLYPGRKVVLWAHNEHLARDRGGASPARMGEWLARRRGAELYVVGFFMGHGKAAWNTRRAYDIAPPPAGSMEALLARGGKAITFVDFTRAGEAAAGGWMSRPIVVRDWGVRTLTLVPARAFDAAIYIDEVTPPEYQ